MDTKVIPLSELQADTEGILSQCYDSGQSLVVELPNHGLVSIRPVESDDDLIDHNPAFRALLEKSLASGREPFPFVEPEESALLSRIDRGRLAGPWTPGGRVSRRGR